MKKKMRNILLTVVMLALLLCACGSSGGAYNAAKEDAYYSASSTAAYAPEAAYAPGDYAKDEEAAEYYYEEPAEVPAPAEGEYADNGSSTPAPATLTNDKLVYTCNLSIETTEYKDTVDKIRASIAKYGAIVGAESESDSDRYWYYEGHRKTSGSMVLDLTVRVPAANYQAFVDEVSTHGNLMSRSQNVENISQQYHSTEARITALETEETRLLEMMEKAETIEEMIYIEQRLTDVEYELNSRRTQLSSMDIDVAYSTVNMSVREVLTYTETVKPAVTFGERIRHAFTDSWVSFGRFWQNFAVWFVGSFPAILFIAAVAIALIVILRKTAPKRAERKARRAEKAAAKAMERAKGKQYRVPGPRRDAPQSPAAPGANLPDPGQSAEPKEPEIK
ncbi:MAG: DUF4349 domain-containing protein [Lachnospiraceae bacterium]|nr:DUF4349 domain-containing protein [Lachnospiraceae bacterium]